MRKEKKQANITVVVNPYIEEQDFIEGYVERYYQDYALSPDTISDEDHEQLYTNACGNYFRWHSHHKECVENRLRQYWCYDHLSINVVSSEDEKEPAIAIRLRDVRFSGRTTSEIKETILSRCQGVGLYDNIDVVLDSSSGIKRYIDFLFGTSEENVIYA